MERQSVLIKLMPRFKDKKVLVLGLGREGKASLEFLLANYQTLQLAELAVSDVNLDVCRACVELATSKYQRTIKAYGGSEYLLALSRYDLILKSPGISFKDLEYLPTKVEELCLPSLKLAPKAEVTCQVDLFLQLYGGQTVAVTGTKGKSTTTTLINELLNATAHKAALLGNIGIPAFTELFSLADKAAALELSCHQLEFTKHSSRVALLTNLYEEHLDHYHNLAEYYGSKLNLIRYGLSDQIVILPAYEQTLINLALPELHSKQTVFYLCKNSIELADLQAIYERKQMQGRAYAFKYELSAHKLAFLGELRQAEYKQATKLPELDLQLSEQLQIEHLQLDCVLAIIATFAYCYTQQVELNVLSQISDLQKYWTIFANDYKANLNDCLLAFKGLEHRLQYVGIYRMHPVYNDSISTIPLAAVKALKALPVCETIILGGLDRGIDYSLLEDYLYEKNLQVIGLKDTGWQIIDRLAKRTKALGLYKAKSMQEAVKIAYDVTLPERGILLSPAAASYNTYKDFVERGLDFVKEIKQQA